jgi:gas vesicle protein
MPLHGIRGKGKESKMSEKTGGFGDFMTGFLMGALVGATVAILTAPRSGEETREQIRVKGVELRGTAEQTVDETLATIKTAALDVSTRAEDLWARSQAALDEAQKQGMQAVDEVKRVALEAIEEMRSTAAQAVDETESAVAEAE